MSSCGPDLCDKPPVVVAQNDQAATSSAGREAGTLPVEGDVTGVNEKSSRISNSSQRKCLRPSRPASLGSHLDGSAAGVELSGAASGDGSQRLPRSTRREDGPPNIFFILSAKLMKTWGEAYSFWRKVREDRFRWGLFKSILFFTVGLKLFNDLARHLASPPSRCGG